MKSKLLVVLGLLSSALGVGAQTSTITYQGQLSSSGSAANGLFDLRFALFDAATTGNQVGNALTNAPTGVTNGLFTTTLDFGSGVFNGSPRWLEIGVRTNGSTNVYATLAPRQPITSTPYAIRAANYSGPVLATNLTGKINDTNLSANVALLTNNVVFTGSVTASNFIGSGLGLTNLAATNLIGTLPDARLSANIPLLGAPTNAFFGIISAANFYGYGGGLTNVPGRKFDSVPTASSIQGQANYGYLATNDSTPVTVTLPLTADIPAGYTIRVSGSGAAGWVIAQNAGQSILVGNLLNSVGVSWITNSSALNLKAIASSADGRKLAAVVNGGFVFTSTNYGTTWTGQNGSGSRNWTSVASSADGTQLVACVNGGLIYTSSDSGVTWAQRAANLGNRTWSGITCSHDGTRVTACASGGTGVVYISTDSGATWPATASLGVANFTAIAGSGTGSNVAATISGGQIWITANGGSTWTNRAGNPSWTCIASSADGSTLVAGANAGANFLHVSTDFGMSWSPGTIAANWAGVACSADGARMIAVVNGGGVYVSIDSGVTWSLRSNLPTSSTTYTGAASSSDGSTMAVVASASGIFISSKSTTTPGTTGALFGSRLAAVELQHVGDGVFIPISYVGTIRAK